MSKGGTLPRGSLVSRSCMLAGMRRFLPFALWSCLLATGCAVSTAPQKPLPKDDDPQLGRDRGAVHYSKANDAPEISRGVGDEGTVVVLWPRIFPKSEDPKVVELATRIQSRLERAGKSGGGEADKRPSPERVCPREGCRGVSVGAVLAMKDKGCAVVATVGPPGAKPVALVTLAGEVELKAKESPFRDPPENLLTVQEFVPCEKLIADLDSNASLPGEAKLGEAIAKARGK